MDAKTTRNNDHNDGRRVRELYRYFRPEHSLSGPRTLNHASSFSSLREDLPPAVVSGLSGEAACSSSSLEPPAPPFSLAPAGVPDALTIGDHNATLNSFAQLAALRLNVQRVLISVSDREQQFILAEGTQSLNCNDSSENSIAGDGVWSGCNTISNAWSMCKATVALPPSSRKLGRYSFLIVNDLSQDERYKRLPFVEGDPNFRFYAGTPLTTDTNINIGCFFVLDDRPRDGLTDAQKTILGSLGMLVMDYFKVSRQASEGRRAARLSRGLSYFVEGSSSFVESAYTSSYAGSTSSPPLSSHLRPNMSVGSHSVGPDNRSGRSLSNDACSFSSGSDYKADHQGTSSGHDPLLPNWLSSNNSKDLPLDESQGSSWLFRRAANLLRESLELGGDGGVVLLEAGKNPVSDVDSSGSECSADGGNPAPVLAISTKDEPFAPEAGSTVSYPAANINRGFMAKLLRRYPKGRLWSFHRDGLFSSSEDEDQSPESQNTKPTDMPRGSKKWKATENSLLNLYFPNASQILFIPLWNAASSQWHAGCFCWNTIETHVISPSVELSSVLGFGTSIMAEYSRVESLISDRQKGDFIGSISHELRSPLHGILAAAEFLNGSDLSEFQGSLLETINACGRTLLDTMNQVLDFSKIVSLERTWRHIRKNKRTSIEAKSMKKVDPSHLDTFVPIDVAVLAEEVVEGVCLGHSYGQKATAAADQPVLVSRPHGLSQDETSPRPEVEVSMDITQNDWVYRTQPGALRRIIMNIFGNAMKYTDAGRVSVRLEVTEASEARTRRHESEELVTLTVSDTGKGISEEFLRGRLYTPFAQEDTLAVGTGLGLSIVRSLVKALNGSINIHSRPGQGTVVKVTLPLVRLAQESDQEASVKSPEPQSLSVEKDASTPTRQLRDTYSGKRAAIMGVAPEQAATHPIWSNITRYLTEWYGLDLVSSSETFDILLAEEQTLTTEWQNGLPFGDTIPSLLILCPKTVDYNTVRAEWSSFAGYVDILRRPCGPHKLARSVRKCFDSPSNGVKPTPLDIPIPLRPNPLPVPTTSELDSSTSTHIISETTESAFGLAPLSSSNSGGASSSSQTSEGTLDGVEPPTSEPPTSELSSLSPRSHKSNLTPTLPQDTRPRVLVVDDNSINLNLMLTFMKKRKVVTLDSAGNGQVAVEAVEKMLLGYDVIFMDISMPVMNGFEATRAIRALEKEREGCGPATIIALTGLSSPRDEAEALASGIDLFLTKPVSFKEVSRLLDEWETKGLRPSESACS